MQAKHRIDWKFFKQTVFDHFTRTTTALFGRLEDEVHSTVKVSVFSQVFSGGQQHGGMAVVAAGVHFAGMAAGMDESVELLHGQSIHVRAQANSAL